MRLIRRRDLLKGIVLMGFSGSAFGGYGVAQALRQSVTTYRLRPPRWTPGLSLRIAVIADLHVCEPWMSLERVEEIVSQTNALSPDAVLLLGDYVMGYRLSRYSEPIHPKNWAAMLGKLKAPLGVHAVLGNHDWWEDSEVQRRRSGPTAAGHALENAGIPVYENSSVRLQKNGKPFWLAGLGDQWALLPTAKHGPFIRNSGRGYEGVDDLPATLAQVTDDAPVILMAHEPDIFPHVPERVSLTVAGHTHGGQIRILGYAPVVPSRYGRRYVYGHIVEDGRHLVVSGGLGCSALPLRVGSTPEIVMLELGQRGEV